jgi:hypothetical protein
MGLRESLGEKKGMAIVAGAMLLVAAVALRREAAPTASNQQFFSADDGRSYFTASVDSVPPFEHDGKPAVRAYVFQCQGERFVGYLERYKEDARRLVLSNITGKSAAATPQQVAAVQQAQMNGREVKRPGEKQWVNLLSPEGAKVAAVRCPAGKSGTPEAVEP